VVILVSNEITTTIFVIECLPIIINQTVEAKLVLLLALLSFQLLLNFAD
jgi:hypothetical protein